MKRNSIAVACDRNLISGIFPALIMLLVLVLTGNIVSAQEENFSGKGLNIFMLWDMEGTSGLFKRDQAWYSNE